MPQLDVPPHLAERTRALNTVPSNLSGEFVLYWMHHAVRGHENAALDVALCLGNHLQRPVLVYQGLGGRHRFNSDRHHAFILEGARDAARELATRGIRHVFWLPSRDDQPSPLAGLLARACALVCEDFPAPPFPLWTRSWSAHARVAAVAVDAFCITPMMLSVQRPERAFAFRQRLANAFEQRVDLPWVEQPVTQPRFSGEVGFDELPLDIDDAALATAIGGCAIDHAVPMVTHTRGGSTAGYARWQTFSESGLDGYHRLRNDAAQAWPLGVSRLSPYLHHGHVSALRIARAARAAGGAGAAKFIDELWTWRELAFHWCAHTDDPESLRVLPEWAQRTLAVYSPRVREDQPQHDSAQGDTDAADTWIPRDRLTSGDSGNPLWDLAQHSLLRHGELHNNLRMSWGKAVLPWSASAKQALQRLIELNHRYALDGNDPASYGGLLWCLGLFDRPFKPARPKLGELRPRSLEQHSGRLDVAAYAKRVELPANGRALEIAVIGAGIAGAACARALTDAGHWVIVLEKSRGPGGRLSTRRDGALRFDHGAQHYVAQDPRFRRQLELWREAGVLAAAPLRVRVAADINATLAARLLEVGVPGMNAPVARLLEGSQCRYGCTVGRVLRRADRWQLLDGDGADLGAFDALFVAIPAPQAAALLAESAPALAVQLASVRYAPRWSMLLQLARSPAVDALQSMAPFEWASAMDARPARPAGRNAWIAHADTDFSLRHLEDSAERVISLLSGPLLDALGLAPADLLQVSAHRWRYAICETPLQQDALWDAELRLGVVGDALRPGVEGACLSGVGGAGMLLRGLSIG